MQHFFANFPAGGRKAGARNNGLDIFEAAIRKAEPKAEKQEL